MLCEIRLLGRFRISVDGHAVADGAWRHRRAAELVKILALTDRHRLHREQIIDMLWPDLGIEAGGANLRKAVHFARRTFDSEAAVELATGVVQLWPHAVVRVDAALFEDAAHSALASKDPNAAAEAAGMYHGDVLPEDRYAEWADEPRERLRSLALQVLKAASMWERVLELEQADEEAHRALMQRSLESGDRVGAIRHFERLRERLRTDLGMGPDQASIALYEKALAAEGREPPTPSERTRALIAWGIVHLNAGDLDEAQRSAGEARALALESNLGPEVGEASALLGIVANMQGRWKELFRSEFMESVRRSPDIAAFVFDAHLCLAEFCMSGPTGHREIVGYARELLDVAEASRSVQGAALAELLLGEGDLFTDELGPAEKHLRRALDLHEQAGSVSGQVIALQRLAEVAIARGHRRTAKQHARQGLRLAADSPLAPHLVVRMHEALLDATTDPEAARRAIEEADESLAPMVVCPPCSIGYRVSASKASARSGRLKQATGRLQEAERLAGMWPGGPWHASVWEARGVLRAARGDLTQAAAMFREAADGFAAAGRTRDEARCRAAAD